MPPAPPHPRQAPSLGNAAATRPAPRVHRLLVLAALFPALSCGGREGARTAADQARLTVVLDSTAHVGDMEAFALPEIAAHDDPLPAPDSGPDSAAILDSAFQRERQSIAADMEELAKLDRAGAEYARRLDGLRPRIAAAESVKVRRDRFLAARTGSPSGAAPMTMPMSGSAPMHHEAAPPKRSDAVIASFDARHTATLELRAGRWWVGTTPRGGIPAHTREVEIRAGAHDTLRLRAP